MKLPVIVFLAFKVSIVVQQEDTFSCFIYHPGRFLEHSGTKSEGQLQNVTLCLERCLKAIEQYGMQCRSAMWRRDTQLCVLSAYDRSQRADKFRVALRSDIDLYENICTETLPVKADVVVFDSDWDIVRTTMKATESWTVTRKPERVSEMKSSQEMWSQRAEEQLSLTKSTSHEEQKKVNKFHSSAIDDEPMPVQKFVKPFNELRVRTFSAPITRPELIVDKPVDGESRSLFKESSKNWRLPPLRRGTISRHFYANTVKQLHSLHDHLPPQQNVSTSDSKVSHQIKGVPRNSTEFSNGTKTVKPTKESTERSPLCFTRIKQKALRDYEERTMSGVDVQICLHTCLNTSSFYCASVNYDELGHICTLNGGSVYFNNAELKNSTSDYYENECNHVRDSQRIVSSTATLGSRAIVPTGCFEIMANSVLLSFDGKLVENAVSLDECQAACTLSNRQCGALNWIPNRNGCMLFGIGYDTKSVVFSSNAQFLIHKCAGRKEPLKVQHKESYHDEHYDSS